MKKLIILLIVFSSISFAQLINPKLVVQQNEYDFGDVVQGEVVSHVFVLSNSGGDLLTISKVRPSCGCTAAMPENTELKPGESTNLNVSFNSTGRMGAQKKLVRIETNDPESPQQIITIKANVVVEGTKIQANPVLNFSETQYDFGTIEEGKVVEHTFKFQNNGKATLNIDDIKTSCGCTAALVSNKKIGPGEEGTLKVELDTKNRKGKMSRTITITSNDPKQPTKILTVYADIKQ
jgi:hypothetical protein